MKILVPVKRVIDFNIKIRVKPDGTGVDTAHVPMSINPFDAIALEAAVQLQEGGLCEEIIAVSVGPLEWQDSLRAALAHGANRAILIKTPEALEPIQVARILEKIVAKEGPQLVILGKQAIDDDCCQTGQMLASFLEWPQGTFASKIKIVEGEVYVTREIETGLETLALTLPAVITTDLRLNEPRYATLPNILKAKTKPLEVLPLESLNIELQTHSHIQHVAPPPVRAVGRRVESITNVMQLLKFKR